MSLPELQTIPYADHFDQWVEYYDSIPEANAIRDTVNLSDATVIETACGTGRLSFELAPHTNEYLAFDADPRLINKAQEKHRPHDTPLTFATAQQEYLPVDDASADVIVSSWGVDHTTIGHILTEYDRVLADDGSLIIIEEAWGDPEARSDYAEILQHVHPGHSFYDETQSRIARVVTGAYDDPIEEQTIESTYSFPSLADAIEAFAFHVTGSRDEGLPLKQQSMLELMLAGFETDDGSIELTEHSTLYHYKLHQP